MKPLIYIQSVPHNTRPFSDLDGRGVVIKSPRVTLAELVALCFIILAAIAALARVPDRAPATLDPEAQAIQKARQ